MFRLIIPVFLFFIGACAEPRSGQHFRIIINHNQYLGLLPISERIVKTLDEALKEVLIFRTQDKKTPITVYFTPGVYFLDKPLKIGPEYSGIVDSNDVTNGWLKFRSLDPRNNPTTLSSGVEIKNWKLYSNGIYQASVNFAFNSLYVGQNSAIRAREPDITDARPYYLIADTKPNGVESYDAFRYSLNEFNKYWKNLQNVEVVSFRAWEQSRMRIQSVDSDRKIVSFQGNIGRPYSHDYNPDTGRYYVENFLEGLDSDNEWYLDKVQNIVYYKPPQGVDPNNLKIFAPKLVNLVEVGELNRLNFDDDITVSLFVKTNPASKIVTIFGNTQDTFGYQFGITSNGSMHALIGSQDPMDTYIGGGCSDLSGDKPNIAINDGQWHHLVYQVKRVTNSTGVITGLLQCYVDGIPQSYKRPIPWDPSRTNNVMPNIGDIGIFNGTRDKFQGQIDEVRVFRGRVGIDLNSEITFIKSLNYNTRKNEIQNILPKQIMYFPFDVNLESTSGWDNYKIDNPSALTYSEGIRGQSYNVTQENQRAIIYSKLTTGIHFTNINFQHTDWVLPLGGYPGRQAAELDAIKNKAAIEFHQTYNSSVFHSDISLIGSHAIFSNGRLFTASNNHFHDIGGSAVVFGQTRGLSISSSNLILDNEIHNFGKVWNESNGIMGGFSNGNVIMRNHIYDGPGGGISMGWGWSDASSGIFGNTISLNKIHNVMQKIHDQGAIYTLSNQPFSKIESNWIYDILPTKYHHIKDWRSNIEGIYLDEGSSEILVQNNIVDNVFSSALMFNSNELVTKYNNVFKNNYFVNSQLAIIRMNGASNVSSGNIFLNNIFATRYQSSGFYDERSGLGVVQSDYNIIHSSYINLSVLWNYKKWVAEKLPLGQERNSLETLTSPFTSLSDKTYLIRDLNLLQIKGIQPLDTHKISGPMTITTPEDF